MAEVPAEIINIIMKFIEEAGKEDIIIGKAYLFGSYAKGTPGKWSDIDIAVISDSFEGKRFQDNIKLSKPKLQTSIDLETHPFRPEDFNENNLFVKEILKTGVRII